MRTSHKLLGAALVVGVLAATGSAFTGTGVTNNAGASQFVGGTISQSVTGATLSSLVYTFGNAPANTAVHSVALTFADGNADGITPTIVFTGGNAADGITPTIVFTGGNAVAFTCDVIAVGTHLSTCTTAGVDRVGVTSVAVTVGS
jgi:hypothetical protein